MLLSAVSVLVVAQSSSEIPEGLMNNPVYLDAKIECFRMSQKQLKIKEPPGSSLCCIEKQTCHVLVTFRYEWPHIFFGFKGVYRLMTVTV